MYVCNILIFHYIKEIISQEVSCSRTLGIHKSGKSSTKIDDDKAHLKNSDCPSCFPSHNGKTLPTTATTSPPSRCQKIPQNLFNTQLSEGHSLEDMKRLLHDPNEILQLILNCF